MMYVGHMTIILWHKLTDCLMLPFVFLWSVVQIVSSAVLLQDFEALTPNLLARTVETVEGGGIAVVLLRSMTSLKQLYTMTMVCILHRRVPVAKWLVLPTLHHEVPGLSPA